MAIITVRPDANVSGANLYTPTGGAGSVHANISDNSDASYIRKDNAVNAAADVIFSLGNNTIAANERVKRVRLRVRVKTDSNLGKINCYLGTRVNSKNYFHSGYAIRGQYSSITDFTGPWFTQSPDGKSWEQTRINGLRGKITEYRDSTDRGFVYEFYVDIEKSSQGSVTVSSPSGTITNTASPDITWAYTDPDAETQAYYEVKVFSQAQYTAGGFSADTSVATWESGEVGSTDVSVPVGTLLLNGTYRAYVRAAKVVNNTPFWSDWAYSQFTLNLTPPPTPTLTASWSAITGATTLTVNGATPTGFTYQRLQVQRSDDGGTNYTDIRNGESITPDASEDAVIYDYEAPRGITVYYRARAVGYVGENVVATVWTTPQQILVTNDNLWWFKAVTDSSLNVYGVPVQANLSVKVDEPNTVFRPLGSDRPKVVAGKLQGEDGSYSIVTTTSAQWDAIVPILKHQGTVLVQDPFGDQKYVRFVERGWENSTPSQLNIRNVTLQYVEVEA
jgi:hypothetical protein